MANDMWNLTKMRTTEFSCQAAPIWCAVQIKWKRFGEHIEWRMANPNVNKHARSIANIQSTSIDALNSFNYNLWGFSNVFA